MMQKLLLLFIITGFFPVSVFGKNGLKIDQDEIKMPERGLCAHRGAMKTQPENTIPAFRAAVEAGAQMIEFDVWLTKDNQMVVLHDETVDRTTNGTGNVSELTLDEIKKLDAGSWKSAEFKGIQIPTFSEVLNEMPFNIWLNVHVKGKGELPEMVARELEKYDRLHQAFMACSSSAAKTAKHAVPGIMVCNMERKKSPETYVEETISAKCEFIQLLEKAEYVDFKTSVRQLKENGVKVNYFGTDSPEEIKALFNVGVDFPLVNDIVHTMEIAKELGVQPVQPIFSK